MTSGTFLGSFRQLVVRASGPLGWLASHSSPACLAALYLLTVTASSSSINNCGMSKRRSTLHGGGRYRSHTPSLIGFAGPYLGLHP